MEQQAGPRKKVKILFAASNPADQTHLHLDNEIREIQRKILLSKYRDALDIQQIWATRPDDLLQYLNMQKPHIVHFSGHGSATGELILVDAQQRSKPVSPEALKALFTVLKENVKVVLLNACFSKIQADAIASVIDCTIGMNRAISDTAAITFASSFYRALGFGRSVHEAFEQGKLALQLEGIPEHLVPELLHRRSVHPTNIYLLASLEQAAVQEASKRIADIERTLRMRDYDTAYRLLNDIWRHSASALASREQARLRYFETLIHLEGQRPCLKSPTVMEQVERLMKVANQLYRGYAYLNILAIIKYDIARAGLRVKDQQKEAWQLIREAQKLTKTSEDTRDIKLLAHDQPGIFQEYRSYLIQQPKGQLTQSKGSNKHGDTDH